MKISDFRGFEPLQSRGDRSQGHHGAQRRQAPEGVRSPSTVNALDRFESRLAALAGADREELQQLSGQIRERIGELSGADDRPLGRSVEHSLKKLLIGAIKALRGGEETAPVEPEPSVGLPDQPGEALTAEAGGSEGAVVNVALDRSV